MKHSPWKNAAGWLTPHGTSLLSHISQDLEDKGLGGGTTHDGHHPHRCVLQTPLQASLLGAVFQSEVLLTLARVKLTSQPASALGERTI